MHIVDMQEICNLLIKNGYRLVRCDTSDTDGLLGENVGMKTTAASEQAYVNSGTQADEMILKKEMDRARRRAAQLKLEEEVGRPALVAKLKNWRRERAAKEGVPPYIILGNMALLYIVAACPATAEELLAVSGVGESKVEKYGREILDIIAEEMEVCES